MAVSLRHSGWLGPSVVAGGLIVLGAVWLGLRPRPSTTRLPLPAPRPTGYVGSAACTACHADVAKRYQSHPMSHSLSPVLAGPIVEDYQHGTEFSPSRSQSYRVEQQGDRVLHHELGHDRKGDVVYDQAVEVHYALGSGRRGRSYLIFQDGNLLVSPVSWYSQNKRWDLSPGYQAGAHQRFERIATARCLECHAGRLAYEGPATTDLVQSFQDPPFQEHGIGCERCHGPGQDHIAWQNALSPVGADPIINPRSLEPARRDAVCNQCHLQGTGHQLRYGRRDGDFRPGDQLGDVWSVFTSGSEVSAGDQTIAVSQVQQMVDSACFRSSDGMLGCISCHDPHAVPAEEDKATFYRDKCLECHGNAGCSLPETEQRQPPAQGSCIACHMPRLGAADVPHAIQTDHRIRRLPARSDRGAGAQAPPETIFDLAENPLLDVERDRAQGLMLAEEAEANQDPAVAQRVLSLLEPVRAAVPNDADVLDALAMAHLLLGHSAEATAAWEAALEVDPNRQDALDSLSARTASENPAMAAGYLERLLTIKPWQASLHLRLAQLRDRQGDATGAIAAAERAIELNPSEKEGYRLLLSLYTRQQDADRAEHCRQQLRRLEWR